MAKTDAQKAAEAAAPDLVTEPDNYDSATAGNMETPARYEDDPANVPPSLDPKFKAAKVDGSEEVALEESRKDETSLLATDSVASDGVVTNVDGKRITPE